MNPFQKRTAIRIAAVSVVLASIASSVSWYLARERAEEGIVALATEESRHLIDHYNATDLAGADAIERATLSAQSIIGGLFDCEYRGKVDAKGKGQIDMYFVKGERQV